MNVIYFNNMSGTLKNSKSDIFSRNSKSTNFNQSKISLVNADNSINRKNMKIYAKVDQSKTISTNREAKEQSRSRSKSYKSVSRRIIHKKELLSTEELELEKIKKEQKRISNMIQINKQSMMNSFKPVKSSIFNTNRTTSTFNNIHKNTSSVLLKSKREINRLPSNNKYISNNCKFSKENQENRDFNQRNNTGTNKSRSKSKEVDKLMTCFNKLTLKEQQESPFGVKCHSFFNNIDISPINSTYSTNNNIFESNTKPKGLKTGNLQEFTPKWKNSNLVKSSKDDITRKINYDEIDASNSTNITQSKYSMIDRKKTKRMPIQKQDKITSIEDAIFFLHKN